MGNARPCDTDPISAVRSMRSNAVLSSIAPQIVEENNGHPKDKPTRNHYGDERRQHVMPAHRTQWRRWSIAPDSQDAKCRHDSAEKDPNTLGDTTVLH